MESRYVTLTLEKAKEFYNSGNGALKEVALQAFTAEELKSVHYTEIKTFEDAYESLGLKQGRARYDINYFSQAESDLGKHLTAIYKLDIILKALNGAGWNPKMAEGNIYFPYIRFYSAGVEAEEAARSNGWEVKETFRADGEKYSLVSGCCRSSTSGLSNFGLGYGDVYPTFGLLACKSDEIAQHMSRYFAKEIFEACYAQHIGAYEWIN